MNDLERLCTELVSAGAPGALAFAAGPEGAFGAAAGTDVGSVFAHCASARDSGPEA